MSMFLEQASGIAFFILLAILIAALFFIARYHVVWAIAWRNVKGFFTSELGYVFIVSFVACCALLTFRRQFFTENQANLDQLTQFFPFVLLFFCAFDHDEYLGRRKRIKARMRFCLRFQRPTSKSCSANIWQSPAPIRLLSCFP